MPPVGFEPTTSAGYIYDISSLSVKYQPDLTVLLKPKDQMFLL